MGLGVGVDLKGGGLAVVGAAVKKCGLGVVAGIGLFFVNLPRSLLMSCFILQEKKR